jgi:hypothetical protein
MGGVSQLIRVGTLFSKSMIRPALLTSVFGVFWATLGFKYFGVYGWWLFLVLPCCLGILSVALFNPKQQQPLGQCLTVSLLSVVLTGLVMMAIAAEGLVCLLMAIPLAIPLALLGAWLAYSLQHRFFKTKSNQIIALLVMVGVSQGLMQVEAAFRPTIPLHSVTSRIVVNAPAQAVWDAFVHFKPIRHRPTEPWFLLGIAYPIKAHLKGTGVGAVRYCEFSTGAFVEPIDVWQPPYKIHFSVQQQPDVLRELSPYPSLHPPHLNEFLRTRAGEFKLQPLANGQTELVGTTWYTQRLWPQFYWLGLADFIIHQVHMRVLTHIKADAES